jgi:hypothetical protein
VTAVPGDLADIDSVRTALDGVSTLFLVVANATDELSKAMLTLNAAREAKVKGIVYLSVFKGEQYSDVPRFASKVVIERMIETCDLPATILRPCYFMQNDAQQKDALLNHGAWQRRPVRGRYPGYRRSRREGASRASTQATRAQEDDARHERSRIGGKYHRPTPTGQLARAVRRKERGQCRQAANDGLRQINAALQATAQRPAAVAGKESPSFRNSCRIAAGPPGY